jgi:dTDP-4-dehydrorhamnose reductase
MKIFLTGAYGQVGWELNRALSPYGEIYACDRDTLDLLDESEVRRAVRGFRPNVIVNAAAYTAVDRAENDRELCGKLNITAPGILAEEAESLGAWMVHFSTDYVFNGKNDRPWTEGDAPDPVNYYGRSKLRGDDAVAKNSPKYLIFRTSWVYAARGSNFLLTMLRLFAQKDELRVVNDQTGAPTWARYIAQAASMALGQAFENDDASLSGVYNLVASGATSWYNFARAIRDYAGGFAGVTLRPVVSEEYPTPAARPKWSVLSSEKIRRVFGVYPAHWMDSMRLCIDEIKERQLVK